MLEDASLLAWMKGSSKDGDPEVRRISLDEPTRASVMEMLERGARELTHCADGSEKTPLPFQADYTARPEADEIIEISPFELPRGIVDAASNPLFVETYVPDEDNLPNIKALVAEAGDGDSFRAVFQSFRPAQYLKASSIHLMYSANTLSTGPKLWERWSSKVGLTVSPTVDACYAEGRLRFASAHYAKLIFDLAEYYAEASKPELQEFVSLAGLVVEDPDYLVNGSNSWERRKIASIRGARIIEDHPLHEMLGFARQVAYELPVTDGKLTIPADKAERRKLLAFLDEDVYRGMFTDSVYQTNSKRTV